MINIFSEKNISVNLFHGDCVEVIKTIKDNIYDACVTDPPYSLVSIQKRFGKDGSAPVKVYDTTSSDALAAAYSRASAGFMGKKWDTGEVAFNKIFWEDILRILKPGAHLLAMGGTRTFHRLVCAIEDAGFEIRDTISWVYGSGFPKSHDQGNGIGTALKPAQELIVLARKPLSEKTIKSNIEKWGTGGLNIEVCRILNKNDLGRWPANLILDGSEEVETSFSNSTCRFFYSAKASKKDRRNSKHPTIKPISLIRYLTRLITPKNGLILDPFAGSGTTGEAAILENCNCDLIEREEEYQNDIIQRFLELKKEISTDNLSEFLKGEKIKC